MKRKIMISKQSVGPLKLTPTLVWNPELFWTKIRKWIHAEFIPWEEFFFFSGIYRRSLGAADGRRSNSETRWKRSTRTLPQLDGSLAVRSFKSLQGSDICGKILLSPPAAFPDAEFHHLTVLFEPQKFLLSPSFWLSFSPPWCIVGQKSERGEFVWFLFLFIYLFSTGGKQALFIFSGSTRRHKSH